MVGDIVLTHEQDEVGMPQLSKGRDFFEHSVSCDVIKHEQQLDGHHCPLQQSTRMRCVQAFSTQQQTAKTCMLLTVMLKLQKWSCTSPSHPLDASMVCSSLRWLKYMSVALSFL